MNDERLAAYEVAVASMVAKAQGIERARRVDRSQGSRRGMSYPCCGGLLNHQPGCLLPRDPTPLVSAPDPETSRAPEESAEERASEILEQWSSGSADGILSDLADVGVVVADRSTWGPLRIVETAVLPPGQYVVLHESHEHTAEQLASVRPIPWRGDPEHDDAVSRDAQRSVLRLAHAHAHKWRHAATCVAEGEFPELGCTCGLDAFIDAAISAIQAEENPDA
jgi:hypothetical protein